MRKMKKIIAVILICSCALILAACGGSSKASAYRVITSDESGAPVAGVNLQFCSDEMCQMGETGADGAAVFDVSEGTYTVKVFSVPEGYAEDKTEYQVPETYGDVNITLKSAE